MSQSRRSLEQIFETQVQTLSLTLQPFTVANTNTLPATSSVIFALLFRRSADSRNSVAIPICWAGSAGFAS